MSADVELLGRLMDSRPDDLEREMLRQWLERAETPEGSNWSTYGSRAEPELSRGERRAKATAYGTGRVEPRRAKMSPRRYNMLVTGDEREESEQTTEDLALPPHLGKGQKGKPRNILNGGGSMTPEFQRRFSKEVPSVERAPRTRAECADLPRPCPFVRCVWHTYLHVTFNGSVRLSNPREDPDDVHPDYSCALDVAERGPHTLDAVARILGMTRERARQIEESALADMTRRLGHDEG